jgi:signal transduction histidine kinase
MNKGGSIAGLLWRGISVALLVSSLITFSALFAIGRAERVKAFDQALLDDLRTIANITQVYPDDDLYVNVVPEALTEYAAGGTRFFQVWDGRDGELLDQSASLKALNHLLEKPSVAPATLRRIETRLPDGRAISLLYQQRFANWGLDREMLERTGLTIRDRPVHLLVGRLRSELTASLSPLAAACAAGALLFPLLAAAFLTVLVPRALRPLRELSEAVAQRDPETTEPFPIDTAREVQPIAQRLNDLLRRIGDQRRKERRFLADTAHELRNPLAELHAMADVALLQGGDTTDYAETFADMKQVAHRLASLVEHLFRLARHARTANACEQVCLSDVIDAALRELAPQCRERSLSWLRSGDARLHVTTDPVLLRALIQNLLGNVVAHARTGSRAQVHWTGESKGRIVVRNECAADETASESHLGSGLSIARTYAYALGAKLKAGRSGNLFEVHVVLKARPRAATAAASAPTPARSGRALLPMADSLNTRAHRLLRGVDRPWRLMRVLAGLLVFGASITAVHISGVLNATSDALTVQAEAAPQALGAAAHTAAQERAQGTTSSSAPQPPFAAFVTAEPAKDAEAGAKWVPRLTETWHVQLAGAIDTNIDADVFEVDLFDTPPAIFGLLKSKGRRVVCHFSAGSAESWRPDMQRFAASDLGHRLDGSPNERWLDTRSATVRQAMKWRLDMAVARGCDGVDPDNLDAYTNNTGFALKEATQLDYNRFIAIEARSRGLAAGLKNNVEQVAALEPYFAFAINEQCHEVSNGRGGNECDAYVAFTARGKPVFNAEYHPDYVVDVTARAALCAAARAANLRTVILPPALDGSLRFSCD